MERLLKSRSPHIGSFLSLVVGLEFMQPVPMIGLIKTYLKEMETFGGHLGGTLGDRNTNSRVSFKEICLRKKNNIRHGVH